MQLLRECKELKNDEGEKQEWKSSMKLNIKKKNKIMASGPITSCK